MIILTLDNVSSEEEIVSALEIAALLPTVSTMVVRVKNKVIWKYP